MTTDPYAFLTTGLGAFPSNLGNPANLVGGPSNTNKEPIDNKSTPLMFHHGPKFGSDSTRTQVTFEIGKGDAMEIFVVNKEVACFYSPVLKAAFTSNFIEGQTQTYKLEDVESGVFQLLVQWLYRQNIESSYTKIEMNALFVDPPTPEIEAVIDGMKENIQERVSNLVRLWVLADRLQIPVLQNLVANSLYELRVLHRCDALQDLYYVYDNTLGGSALRRLMVVAFAESYGRIMDCPEYVPKEMLLQIGRYLAHNSLYHPYNIWDPLHDKTLFRKYFYVDTEEDTRTKAGFDARGLEMDFDTVAETLAHSPPYRPDPPSVLPGGEPVYYQSSPWN